MLTEINRIKQDSIFKDEADFFNLHRDNFTQSLVGYLDSVEESEHFYIDKSLIAKNFYDSIFNSSKDCFDIHIEWMKFSDLNNIGFLFSSLMYDLLEAFMEYKNTKDLKKSISLIRACAALQKEILSALENKNNFDVSTYLPKKDIKDGIIYLRNMHRLGRGVRFVTHTELGTCSHIAYVQQIGQYSASIKISNEQMAMILSAHSSFILKSSDDEKNFSVQIEILSPQENIVIMKNMQELESSPLLSRKYPRAAIIHASLVHIANKGEYITGNMIDISQGGMGIISSTKSSFEKGQSIVAFLSYEDKETEFKFSLEATGIITSIIGIENVFRYGIQLDLNEEEREIVHKLVWILSGRP